MDDGIARAKVDRCEGGEGSVARVGDRHYIPGMIEIRRPLDPEGLITDYLDPTILPVEEYLRRERQRTGLWFWEDEIEMGGTD
jgi:hypothetical protein